MIRSFKNHNTNLKHSRNIRCAYHNISSCDKFSGSTSEITFVCITCFNECCITFLSLKNSSICWTCFLKHKDSNNDSNTTLKSNTSAIQQNNKIIVKLDYDPLLNNIDNDVDLT